MPIYCFRSFNKWHKHLKTFDRLHLWTWNGSLFKLHFLRALYVQSSMILSIQAYKSPTVHAKKMFDLRKLRNRRKNLLIVWKGLCEPDTRTIEDEMKDDEFYHQLRVVIGAKNRFKSLLTCLIWIKYEVCFNEKLWSLGSNDNRHRSLREIELIIYWKFV